MIQRHYLWPKGFDQGTNSMTKATYCSWWCANRGRLISSVVLSLLSWVLACGSDGGSTPDGAGDSGGPNQVEAGGNAGSSQAGLGATTGGSVADSGGGATAGSNSGTGGSDSTSGGGGVAGEGLASNVASFCADSAAETCRVVADCCSVPESECLLVSEQSCLEGAEVTLAQGLEFNVSAVPECQQLAPQLFDGCSYRSADSDQYQEVVRACSSVFAGAVPIGGACMIDAACASTSTTLGVCRSSESSGTCAQMPVLAAGDECGATVDGVCGAGLYCDSDAGSCAAKKTVGSSCSLGADCLSALCNEGLCAQPELEDFCATLM